MQNIHNTFGNIWMAIQLIPQEPLKFSIFFKRLTVSVFMLSDLMTRSQLSFNLMMSTSDLPSDGALHGSLST